MKISYSIAHQIQSRTEELPRISHGKPSARQLVSFYRSLSIMLNSGIPIFAIFEFLSRHPEHPKIGEGCRRIAQNLVEGQPLHEAAQKEKALFDRASLKLLEVGFHSGRLVPVLERLARAREENWKLKNQIKSQLTYPFCIVLVTLAAVLLLPPLALGSLLEQIVGLTSEPPLVTRALLSVSSFLSSPVLLSVFLVAVFAFGWWFRGQSGEDFRNRYERVVWEIPALGELWRTVVSIRFLRIFALTYECGMPVTECLQFAAMAGGSLTVAERSDRMVDTLFEGASLRESLEVGDFLPRVALESVQAGEEASSIPALAERTAEILQVEMEHRIELVAKLVEPLVMLILGLFVGFFALACLLPILQLVDTL